MSFLPYLAFICHAQAIDVDVDSTFMKHALCVTGHDSVHKIRTAVVVKCYRKAN